MTCPQISPTPRREKEASKVDRAGRAAAKKQELATARIETNLLDNNLGVEVDSVEGDLAETENSLAGDDASSEWVGTPEEQSRISAVDGDFFFAARGRVNPPLVPLSTSVFLLVCLNRVGVQAVTLRGFAQGTRFGVERLRSSQEKGLWLGLRKRRQQHGWTLPTAPTAMRFFLLNILVWSLPVLVSSCR